MCHWSIRSRRWLIKSRHTASARCSPRLACREATAQRATVGRSRRRLGPAAASTCSCSALLQQLPPTHSWSVYQQPSRWPPSRCRSLNSYTRSCNTAGRKRGCSQLSLQRQGARASKRSSHGRSPRTHPAGAHLLSVGVDDFDARHPGVLRHLQGSGERQPTVGCRGPAGSPERWAALQASVRTSRVDRNSQSVQLSNVK